MNHTNIMKTCFDLVLDHNNESDLDMNIKTYKANDFFWHNFKGHGQIIIKLYKYTWICVPFQLRKYVCVRV